MPFISQSKAAKLAGVSRGTIANRIDEGVLSRAPEGIDLAELARVFPDISVDRIERFLATDGASDALPTGVPTGANSPVIDRSSVGTLPTGAGHLELRLVEADRNAAWLREIVEQRDQVIAEKERQLEQAQARLDEREAFWTSQLTQLQALLPAPESTPEPTASRGFWSRLFG